VEKELYDIPIQAKLCYEKNRGLILPEKVPYLGMGSSFFAAQVLRYLGVKYFLNLPANTIIISGKLISSKMGF
jgi:glucosamine--fructose-6-phosphate aminotransferase (isomerizing)